MKRPSPAFPLEAIFPGIHKERPDVAAKEGEDLLAYGHKCDGFDLDDAENRAQFVDCVREKFGDFQVKPAPAIAKMLDALPEDWEQRAECASTAQQIADAAAAHYRLPAHLMCVIVNGRLLYVVERPDDTPRFRPKTLGR